MNRYADSWSCSKFARWLRGKSKPASATSEGWREWEEQARAAHPLRFWLAETGLDMIQDVLWFPYSVYDRTRSYLRNRFVTKTHFLKTGLAPGQWYDFDTRLREALFLELVLFVEEDLAYHDMAWFPEEYGKPRRYYRSAEAGLRAIARQRKYAENPDEPAMGYAKNAVEVGEIYDWIVNKRPARNAAFEAEFDDSDWYKDIEKVRRYRELEKQYEQEDIEMMVRIVRAAPGMWT